MVSSSLPTNISPALSSKISDEVFYNICNSLKNLNHRSFRYFDQHLHLFDKIKDALSLENREELLTSYQMGIEDLQGWLPLSTGSLGLHSLAIIGHEELKKDLSENDISVIERLESHLADLFISEFSSEDYDINGCNALHVAAKSGKNHLFQFLLEKGLFNLSKRDDKGRTALAYALEFLNRDSFSSLMQKISEPEELENQLIDNFDLIAEKYDEDGSDLLFQLLFHYLTDTDENGGPETALIPGLIKIYPKHRDRLWQILKNLNDLNDQLFNDSSESIFMMAISREKWDLAEELYRAGASIHLRNSRNENFLEFFIRQKQEKITLEHLKKIMPYIKMLNKIEWTANRPNQTALIKYFFDSLEEIDSIALDEFLTDEFAPTIKLCISDSRAYSAFLESLLEHGLSLLFSEFEGVGDFKDLFSTVINSFLERKAFSQILYTFGLPYFTQGQWDIILREHLPFMPFKAISNEPPIENLVEILHERKMLETWIDGYFSNHQFDSYIESIKFAPEEYLSKPLNRVKQLIAEGKRVDIKLFENDLGSQEIFRLSCALRAKTGVSWQLSLFQSELIESGKASRADFGYTFVPNILRMFDVPSLGKRTISSCEELPEESKSTRLVAMFCDQCGFQHTFGAEKAHNRELLFSYSPRLRPFIEGSEMSVDTIPPQVHFIEGSEMNVVTIPPQVLFSDIIKLLLGEVTSREMEGRYGLLVMADLWLFFAKSSQALPQ